MKVFIDTNIWFSAIYKQGLPHQVIFLCFEKGYEIVISQQVLEEIFLVLKRKYSKGIPLIKQLFLQIHPTILKDPTLKELKKVSKLAVSEDLPLLASALKYHCHYFITGNIKDFVIKKIKKQHKLSVTTPREFLNRLSVPL
ncbi:putative toxin-antitoxin system toxin component, PIN family [Candidatus Microgenomates bacterium]|nr:putative toxin-antitoxin system toxin component, PIN family [Candidatus Microgenomates bacterium]